MGLAAEACPIRSSLADPSQGQPGQPQAAGVIHSDFERGFIRAQAYSHAQRLEAGSLAEARNRGWLRSEGKEYVVAEGDVMEFLFNV